MLTQHSAVYVCNDADEDLNISMDEAMDQMQYLMSVCIGGNSIGKSAVSGRVMMDSLWNLNIGYGNCNHVWKHECKRMCRMPTDLNPQSPGTNPSYYSNGWPGLLALIDCGRASLISFQARMARPTCNAARMTCRRATAVAASLGRWRSRSRRR